MPARSGRGPTRPRPALPRSRTRAVTAARGGTRPRRCRRARWVGERADGVEHLDDRARPAVGHDQRQRVRVLGPDVHEVDVHAVDLSGELRQRVQPGFDPPSVVLCRPVLAQRLHRGQLHTLRAVADKLPARPARRRQPAPQIVERVFGDLHGERSDGVASLLLERSHVRHCLSVGTQRGEVADPAGRQTPSQAASRIWASRTPISLATSGAARTRETPWSMRGQGSTTGKRITARVGPVVHPGCTPGRHPPQRAPPWLLPQRTGMSTVPVGSPNPEPVG